MESICYDFEEIRRKRQQFLDSIPLPDEAFLEAAKYACIRAGISQETIDILHPPKSSRPGR